MKEFTRLDETSLPRATVATRKRLGGTEAGWTLSLGGVYSVFIMRMASAQ